MDAFLPEHLGGLGWRLPGQSYTRYLSLINKDKIRDRTVRKELREFFGNPEEPHSLSYIGELRSEYYSRNSLQLSLSEWELCDVDVKAINESTDIPIVESTEAQATASLKSRNSFTELIDTMVRLENATSKRLFTIDGKVDRSNPATTILSNNGYITNSEKEPSSQSDSLKEFNYEQSKSKPSSGIFSPDFQKEAKSFKFPTRDQISERIRKHREENGVEEEAKAPQQQPKRSPRGKL